MEYALETDPIQLGGSGMNTAKTKLKIALLILLLSGLGRPVFAGDAEPSDPNDLFSMSLE